MARVPPRKAVRRRVTTVYMDEDVAQAAKLKAATTGMSVSDQVNRALLRSLTEDESDLRLIKQRSRGPMYDYDEFLAEMKRSGRI